MGIAHNRDLQDKLQAEARGRYYITLEQQSFQTEKKNWVTGVDDSRPERKYALVNRSDYKKVAGMTIQSLPGCCGVVLLSNFNGAKAEDIAKFIDIACEAARKAGYGYALLTLRAESRILEVLTTGDFHRTGFLNGKTGNQVTVYGRVLPQQPKPSVVLDNEVGD
jgi:hypothetical protein